MHNYRTYGLAPYCAAIVHGGPGAVGELAPVARELSRDCSILEPLQAAASLDGQVAELQMTLEQHAAPPVALVGYSWGAWLSFIVAAQYPVLIRKLILVASGPFEERYVAQLQETRLKRLSDDQVQELTGAYRQCTDGPTHRRDQAVRLYGTGYPVAEIQKITGCSTTRLMEWRRTYAEHGMAALQDGRRGGNSAKLTDGQRVEIDTRLHAYTPHDLSGTATQTADGQFWTVEDLQQAIAQWFGVRYASRTAYPRLFHACGFSDQRPEKV